MKQLLFLFLFPCLAMAQYTGNAGQKITLGEQTTADGLVFRGVASIDTVTATSKITRANKQDTSAFLLLDTVTNLLWHYKTASNGWIQAGGSTFDTTTLNLVSRFALKLNITDTSNIKYVNTYGTQTVNGAKTFTSAVTATKLNVTDSIQSNSGIYKINSSTLGLNVDNTTPFRITNSGNWGIYNDNPQNLLSTFSSSARGGVISNAYPILMFNEPSKSKFVFGLDENEGYLWGFTNVKLIIATNMTEKMRIETNGNVGIGETTPTEKLHVVGNARISGLANAANPVNVQVDVNGVLVRTSSIDIKEDVQSLPYGLNEVMLLQPSKFSYIDKYKYGEGYDIGFIAQDVNDVIPEAVGTGIESDIFMDSVKLIPVLTKAIQEQQALIKALEQRILILENK